MQKVAHIVGAGISGLSAAVRLANANFKVRLYEATQQAGGRCRSYFDAATNLTIDNGNHLLLSGNRHALAYARSIGTEAGLVGTEARPVSLRRSEDRQTLAARSRRQPPAAMGVRFRATGAGHELARLSGIDAADLVVAFAGWSATPFLARACCTSDWCSRCFWPRSMSIRPSGSAGLAGAVVRETLLAGGQACRPLIAREGLSAVLVEPAIKLLQGKGADIRFGQELRGFGSAAGRVNELKFGEEAVSVASSDIVVLAVPPRPAASLLPGLTTPSKFRAIVNAHFRFEPPEDLPAILGVVGGLVEWLFAFPQRLSITISGADRLVDMPREELAQAIWRDICQAAGITAELPPWQIVRERRATFEATPEQNALRPGAVTAFKNLFLAGDWTDTGLPATIEGSVRSGNRAADLVLAMPQG